MERKTKLSSYQTLKNRLKYNEQRNKDLEEIVFQLYEASKICMLDFIYELELRNEVSDKIISNDVNTGMFKYKVIQEVNCRISNKLKTKLNQIKTEGNNE